jgi:hypothetical protein
MISSHVFAQEKLNRSIQLDLGGLGGYAGVFYEQNLIQKQHIGFNFRSGFSSYKLLDFERKFNPILIIPSTLLGVIGSKKYKFEYGFGTSLSFFPVIENNKKIREHQFSVHQILSFRIDENRFLYKFSFIVHHEETKKIRPWFGFTVGYRLKNNINE